MSIKNILKNLDTKYEQLFNNFMTNKNIGSILEKIKISPSKIVGNKNLNRSIRYGLVIFIVGISYFFVFGGDNIYKGETLKAYTVMPENLKSKIDGYGLLSNNLELKPIHTKKLTKDMVDNNIRSYNLIEEESLGFIESNLDKLIDWDKSIDESLRKEYSSLKNEIRRHSSNIDKIISEEEFMDKYKENNPISLELLIKSSIVSKNYQRNNIKGNIGCVNIDLSKIEEFSSWKKKVIDETISKISFEKTNKAQIEASKSLYSIISNSMEMNSLEWIEKNFSLNSDNIKLLAPNQSKRDILISFIFNGVKSETEASRNINFEKTKSDFFEKLNTISPKKIDDIKNILDNYALSFDDVYKEIEKIELPENVIPYISSNADFISYMRDNEIINKELENLKPKLTELLNNPNIKNSFVEKLSSDFNTKQVNNGTLRTFWERSVLDKNILTEDFSNNLIKESFSNYYDNTLKDIILFKYLKFYLYSNLKIRQMEKDINNENTFKENFVLIENKIPENLKNQWNIDYNNISKVTNDAILSDDILKIPTNLSFIKKPNSFWKIFNNFGSINNDRFGIAAIEAEDIYSDKNKFLLSKNLIIASRTINCFDLLEKESKTQKIAKLESEAKAKEDKLEEEKIARQKIEGIFREDGLNVLKEILALSKNLNGDVEIELDKKIIFTKKGSDLKVPIYISDIAPEIKSERIIIWTAKDLMEETSNPNLRKGMVGSFIWNNIGKNLPVYELSFKVNFAGTTVERATMKAHIINDKYIFPIELSENIKFKRNNKTESPVSRITAISNKLDTVAFNFDIFSKTPYYNSMKSEFFESARSEYEDFVSRKLIKEFPTKLDISMIDKTYPQNIFNLILQNDVSVAFNKTLSLSYGDKFELDEFIKKLSFENNIKTPLAKDSNLMEAYKEITKKHAEQRQMKLALELDAEQNRYSRTNLEKNIITDVGNIYLSTLDTKNDQSVSTLMTISSIAKNALIKNNTKASDYSNEVEISGTLALYSITNNKDNTTERSILIKFDEKTPQIVKDLYSNIKINPRGFPIEYYKAPIEVEFKAKFKITSDSKGFIFPDMMIY